MLLILCPSFRSFYSSETERDFSVGFLLGIEFCEAALYCPYFESSTEFLVGFPYRSLTDQDRNVLTSNFSIREKALLKCFCDIIIFFRKLNLTVQTSEEIYLEQEDI